MRRELHYFSIMPKTVLEGAESRITIRPTSPHMRFAEGSVHRVTLGSGSDRGKLVPKSEMEDGEKSCVYFCGARTANRHR